MPHSRRRKFSVRNRISGRQPSKPRNNLKSSDLGPCSENKSTSCNATTLKCSEFKSNMEANSSGNIEKVDLIPDDESSVSMVATVKKRSNTTVDKNVTASSSNMDLFNLMYTSEDITEPCRNYSENIEKSEIPSKRVTRQMSREGAPLRREKYLRQHRIKVRSPKRRIGIGILDTQNMNHPNDIDKLILSVGTEAIDWEREREVGICENNALNEVETNEVDERQSNHSSDDMCRICHGGDSLTQELGLLISACSCRGTVGRVHVKCLERWLTESGKSRCELCRTRYITRRVHRYGVPRALVMWILSQNAKQLMVDSLGIMLMSPLAVLAAWLSGRTLAGLMTHDVHTTPWPLASTFVLACMTLVCYYCWIVSAATRHALGWWIWYRSQYEVRLQLLDEEE